MMNKKRCLKKKAAENQNDTAIAFATAIDPGDGRRTDKQ